MARWDDDGSLAAQRAERRAEREFERQERAERFERAERNEHMRDFLGFETDGGRRDNDLLGLRLGDDSPTLAEQYGVTLLDSASRAEIESWNEPSHEYFARHQVSGEADAPIRAPQAGGATWQAGSALGGPSVSIGKGPVEYGVSIPLGVAGVDVGYKEGSWSYGAQVGLNYRYLIEAGVGFSFRPDAPLFPKTGEAGRLEAHIQGRVLGIGVKITLDTIADKLDAANQDAARRMAPYAEQFMRQLGVHLP